VDCKILILAQLDGTTLKFCCRVAKSWNDLISKTDYLRELARTVSHDEGIMLAKKWKAHLYCELTLGNKDSFKQFEMALPTPDKEDNDYRVQKLD